MGDVMFGIKINPTFLSGQKAGKLEGLKAIVAFFAIPLPILPAF